MVRALRKDFLFHQNDPQARPRQQRCGGGTGRSPADYHHIRWFIHG